MCPATTAGQRVAVGLTTPSFVDTDVLPGDSYCYEVTGFRDGSADGSGLTSLLQYSASGTAEMRRFQW